ncbi:MAG: tRNA-(ms[2]io[6]A)-hydroxylase [Planctomycetaceae bacterium]|nr:MAG: tRNA-(ms[2]io[6]A)-hydroxylase [Planctomycetaceae bacterium]
MLHLRSASAERWLRQVDERLDEVLIDHAHCERKAATTALGLMNAYVDDVELGREMGRIVEEELEHYWMVLDLLGRRGIGFRRLSPGPYGRRLHELVRSGEPGRAIDRLLIAGLIEARSCERFRLLSDHVRDRDGELADFYAGLFESEARHHATYVRLAEHFTGGDRSAVRQRLDELSGAEAEIIAEGSPLARMHS